MTFRPRPYDPHREDRQTDAQKIATQRNFRVFRLHGLHSQISLLTGPRRDLAQMLVDQELVAMGAATTEEVQRKRVQKAMRKAKKTEPNKCFDCGADWTVCECIPF